METNDNWAHISVGVGTALYVDHRNGIQHSAIIMQTVKIFRCCHDVFVNDPIRLFLSSVAGGLACRVSHATANRRQFDLRKRVNGTCWDGCVLSN